jgi:hypothetical protein
MKFTIVPAFITNLIIYKIFDSIKGLEGFDSIIYWPTVFERPLQNRYYQVTL